MSNYKCILDCDEYEVTSSNKVEKHPNKTFYLILWNGYDDPCCELYGEEFDNLEEAYAEWEKEYDSWFAATLEIVTCREDGKLSLESIKQGSYFDP